MEQLDFFIEMKIKKSVGKILMQSSKMQSGYFQMNKKAL